MGNYIEERPWGKFEILYDGEDCKVKRITVNPGCRLSLQSHEKREEVWTCVSGILGVVRGSEITEIHPGYTAKIHLNDVHRAFNASVGHELTVFIEVQTGTYFGEDDITRYEDDYGRK